MKILKVIFFSTWKKNWGFDVAFIIALQKSQIPYPYFSFLLLFKQFIWFYFKVCLSLEKRQHKILVEQRNQIISQGRYSLGSWRIERGFSPKISSGFFRLCLLSQAKRAEGDREKAVAPFLGKLVYAAFCQNC